MRAFAAALRMSGTAWSSSEARGFPQSVNHPAHFQNRSCAPFETMTPCAGRGKLSVPDCSAPSTGRASAANGRGLSSDARRETPGVFRKVCAPPVLRRGATSWFFGSRRLLPDVRFRACRVSVALAPVARSGSSRAHAPVAQDAAFVSGGVSRHPGRNFAPVRVSRKNLPLQVDESRAQGHFKAVIHKLEPWR